VTTRELVAHKPEKVAAARESTPEAIKSPQAREKKHLQKNLYR
jgi:hypothetical protein